MTYDVCVCVTVVLSLFCSLPYSPFFSGPGTEFVDRYDYLRYGSNCDEWDDDEY